MLLEEDGTVVKLGTNKNKPTWPPRRARSAVYFWSEIKFFGVLGAYVL